MYNPKTKLTIIIGTKCTKKFELNDTKPLPNNILKDILSKNLIKGEYEIIDNIIKYSNDIKQQIIKYYENKITYNISIEIINELIKEIKDLIDTFLLNFLNDLYDSLNTRINKNNMHKELINKSLVYSVKTIKIYNYEKNKIYSYEKKEYVHFFKNIDDCNEYILSLKTFNEHTIINKIDILYNNNIIQTYHFNNEKNTNKIIKYYENKIRYNISIRFIQSLIIDIKYLIDTFLLNFLIDLYEILNTKIIKNNMHKELINKCLVYSVKTKDENDENNENIQYFKNIDEYNEYINHILKPICETFKTCKYYNNEHIHYKRNSQFKIVILYKNHIIKTYYNNDEKNNNKIKESNNLCNCSLDICKCEKPNYELIKLSNNYYCNSCNKWKCRCN